MRVGQGFCFLIVFASIWLGTAGAGEGDKRQDFASFLGPPFLITLTNLINYKEV